MNIIDRHLPLCFRAKYILSVISNPNIQYEFADNIPIKNVSIALFQKLLNSTNKFHIGGLEIKTKDRFYILKNDILEEYGYNYRLYRNHRITDMQKIKLGKMTKISPSFKKVIKEHIINQESNIKYNCSFNTIYNIKILDYALVLKLSDSIQISLPLPTDLKEIKKNVN